jgi:putative redox protein
MQTKRVSFTNDAGHRLAGLLDMPTVTPRAYALFAHCFTCSKNVKAAGNIARSLNAAGIAVLRFDFTGLGESEGDFADSNFSANVSDLVAATRYLAQEHQAPALLIGHSLGGAAVLAAAAEIDSAVAVATIAAPAHAAHVEHLLRDAKDEIVTQGEAEVLLGGRPFTVRKQFLDDLAAHELPESVAQLRKALLIMHAPLDDVVNIDNASSLFQHAKHPKSFLSLDKADHLLSRTEDARYAGSALAAWALRYLPASSPADDAAAIPTDEVTATTAGGGFRTELSLGGFAALADEPAGVGGTGSGPTPYDYLAAALAACTTMTLQMYAKHKGLVLDEVSARVSHGKVHARDCEDCESKDGKIDEFRREISYAGGLDKDQEKRLLEIADRCPVHRTLHSEVKVRTKLAE